MNNKKANLSTCTKCHSEQKLKYLKKVNGDFLCRKCYRQLHKKKRELITREILGISKEQELKENKEIKNRLNREYHSKKRKRSNLQKKPKKTINEPKVRGAKRKTIGKYTPMSMYITKTEKNFLYKKYLKQGCGSITAGKKVDQTVDYLKNLVRKLREKGKEEKEINRKFQEEFARLIS